MAKPFEFPDHPEWGVTYWDWTITPVLDQLGEVDFLVFSLEDVSARIKAEKALIDSEKRYRSLTLATTEIVWTTNADGEVVEDLPAWQEFTGQTMQEAKGRGWNDMLHPDDRQRARSVWSEAVKAGKFYEIEYRLHRRDGEYREVVRSRSSRFGKRRQYQRMDRNVRRYNRTKTNGSGTAKSIAIC